METFVRSLSWNQKVPDLEGQGAEMKDQELTKDVTFYELNRNDKRQHKLHGLLMSVFTQGAYDKDAEEDDKVKIDIPTDKIYDLSVKVIKNLAILNTDFTEADRNEALSDSICIYNFGLWYLGTKAAPFFSKLKMT
jgi:hypothetical protein